MIDATTETVPKGTLEMLTEVRELLNAIATHLGIDARAVAADLAGFQDINAGHLYTVPDLVRLRGGTPQAWYAAIRRGTLRETLSGGRKLIRGADAIAWLRSRRAYTYPPTPAACAAAR